VTARRQPASGRSPDLAWLITGPLALLSVVLTTVLALTRGPLVRDWWLAGIFFVVLIVTNIGVLHVVVRRQGFSVTVNEMPLVLALFMLPPVTVIVICTLASLVTQLRRRLPPAKLWFNVAKTATGSSMACMVVVALGPMPQRVGPVAWGILFAAALTSSLITTFAVVGVLSLVQSKQAGWETARAATPTVVTACINILVGLLVLTAVATTAWSVALLAVLAAALAVVYRSYADFFRQHRTLSEVYELTRAVTESGQDATLIDSLLVRVRSLMQAEYATLYLPSQGRHPEVLLTSKVEAAGLLDFAQTPLAIRQRAIDERRSVAVGSRLDRDRDLEHAMRAARIKDCIVVPLRSGQAVIGTLEMVNRLGDVNHFTPGDVQVLETIGAHAAVAVENSRLVDRLRYDAYHDRLTGLPNRRRVTDALAASVKVRTPGEVVAVLLFDVAGLRDVNESMGHAAGDTLLVEVAQRLRRLAGSGALVGRIGGDEFVVTLRAESTEAALQLASDLREQARQPMVMGSLTLDVDTAAGVAVQPDHGDDPNVLLQRAELAANAAKAVPYGVQLFQPALESRAVRRLGLAGDLRRALEDGELEVWFQPKVTLADRHLVGVECLARWDHPVHGMVAPEDFVAVAEHTGQLDKLTGVVLAEALKRCRKWADAYRPMTVSVNLSARTLLDPRFPSMVEGMLADYGVPADQITFEIAEAGMLGDTERALPTLVRLRDIGVRLSVDDFGTGASSLSYLRRLPVHEVKIDQSFVQGMATDSGDLAIVRAVIGLSREFGLTVVAEGVESERTLRLLEELGCEIGQGFLFSRPLPYARLEAWLRAQTEPEKTPTGEVRRLRAVH
jgi:diguanylate cyclase (GGDEF)-like protein